MKYQITPEEKGTRLDKYLVEKLSNLTRSQIQKIIKSGAVLVNGKKPTPHHFLKGGDVIDTQDIKALKKKPVVAPKITKREKMDLPDINIIYEDNDFLVIDKPAGLLTHPVQNQTKEPEVSLVDWLVKHYPKIKTVGDDTALRPGIVHRLDKEASGVMIVAKNQKAFDHLKQQFQNREIKKEYRAWIYGKLANEVGTINFAIGRSRESGKMAARPIVDFYSDAEENQEGKDSVTDYEVLEVHPHRSLIKAFPRTGRTHQIRVHLYAMGHPLLGDSLYKIKSFVPIAAPRLMLHAHKLSFKDFDGVEKTFVSPIPKEFEFK